MRNINNINGFLAILLTPLTFISFFLEKDNKEIWTNEYVIYSLWISYGIILLWVVGPYFIKVVKNIKFWLGLDVIIEYQNGHLEFLDKYGKEASYYEESEFKKVRFKRKENQIGNLKIDGVFDEKYTLYNCFANLNDAKNRIEIVYGSFNRKDDESELLHENQRHFSYSLKLIDSFQKKEEYWEIHSQQYTKIYNVKLSFSLENPPKNVSLLELYKDKNGETQEKELSITPLIIQKYNRIMIKVKLLDLKEGKTIRICWEWDIKKTAKKK